jgi:Domain of unknown function (DUF1992)
VLGVRFQVLGVRMFEKIVEEQIRRAIADGEFENLRGKGRLWSWKATSKLQSPCAWLTRC